VRRERSGSLRSLRERNRVRVIESLRELGVASRADVARHTGLSPATVSTIVTQLRDSGVVVDRGDDDPPAQRSGRPPLLIGLDRSVGVAAGIDFGKRHVAVAVSDLSHRVLAESRREMPDDYTASDGMDAAVEILDDVLADAAVERDAVIGVGLGLPGPIHLSTGTVGSSAILPGWVGVHPAAQMTERLELPVHVENDANLGALAELHWGAGRGSSTLVYLKVATGIGAGLVIGGRLFHGAGGTAGEIGHTMVDETGPICRCGSRGCLEMVAGGPAVVALLEPRDGHDLTAEAVVEHAIAGDAGSRRAIADAGRHIGHALSNLCNLFNPDRIVVGGTLGTAGEILLAPLREAVRQRTIPSAAEDVEIVPTALGDRAEMLGAVALVLYRSEHDPALGQPFQELSATGLG